jgi:hypothetical protein
VIVLAVRWYLRFRLSHRDVEELLAERGVEVDHVTVYRWVLRFTPLLVDAARPCRHRVGDRWSVDETYVKAGGRCLRHSTDSPRPSGSLRQPCPGRIGLMNRTQVIRMTTGSTAPDRR